MQVSKESENAIRMLCFLKQGDCTVSDDELAQLMELDPIDTDCIIQKLCEKRILERSDTSNNLVFRGNPCSLALLDVIATMDGSAKISVSLEDKELPVNDIDHELRRLHKYVQKGIERCYGAVTISDVVDRASARAKQAKSKRFAGRSGK